MSDAASLVRTGLSQFREVKQVELRGHTILITVERRSLNTAIDDHITRLARIVAERFGMGTSVQAASDEHQHWDPNFERSTGVGGRVPTLLGTPDGQG
jgi:hypothetical protein